MPHSDGEPAEPLPPGRRIAGRYEVQAAVLQTSFGWVYKVRDLIFGKTLAICVLSPSLRDEAGIRRFHECVHGAVLKAPGSGFRGEIDSLGEDSEGEFYVVMKFIEGDPAALDVSLA